MANVIMVLVVGSAYVVAAIVSIVLSASSFSFDKGYPSDSHFPMHYVSDMFGFEWFLVFVSFARVILPLFFVWLLVAVTATWKMSIFGPIIGGYVLLDVFLLIALGIEWLFCNSSIWPSNLCNDGRFCDAYRSEVVTRCANGTETLDPAFLTPNPAFLTLFWFQVAFAVSDVIMIVISRSLRRSVVRYIYAVANALAD
jgi:hypothetical protein